MVVRCVMMYAYFVLTLRKGIFVSAMSKPKKQNREEALLNTAHFTGMTQLKKIT
jgi:hypothetical protein